MHPETWLEVEALSDALKVSVRSIRKLVANGDLVAGRDYYSVGTHVTAKQIFSLEKVRYVLLTLTQEAAKEKSITTAVTYDKEHSAQLVAGGRI